MIADHQAVDLFAENLRQKGKQPATVESYCRDAQRFLTYLQKFKLPAQQVTPETLLAYQEFLKVDCEERGNSVRRTVIGIRQFFRFLTDARVVQSTPFDAVPIPLRDETQPKGLTTEHIEALLAVASAGKPDAKAARDSALVALLAYEGIKANELIALKWSDYLQEQGHGSLHIGGPRARAIPLSEHANTRLQVYKRSYGRIRHQVGTAAGDKKIFIAFKGRDAASPLPVMTRHGLKFILYELGDKVGLSRLNTEQLRHFAVNHLIMLGKSPEEIMAHLGLRRLGNIAKHLAQGGHPLRQMTSDLPDQSPRE